MPYSLPKVQTPTNALVVADLRDDRMDAQIAACVLQGIVNRESEEKIYVHHTYCADNRGDWRVPRTAISPRRRSRRLKMPNARPFSRCLIAMRDS